MAHLLTVSRHNVSNYYLNDSNLAGKVASNGKRRPRVVSTKEPYPTLVLKTKVKRMAFL